MNADAVVAGGPQPPPPVTDDAGTGSAALSDSGGPADQPRLARQSVCELWILRAVAGMLVCCVLAFGAVVAVRTPVFSPVDEKAHFEYVQYVAEHHAVPVLGKHYPSLSVLELDPSFSTKRYGTDPRRMGIVGLAYEDFQPPLYYALAVPAYELSGNLHTKVIVLRLFDLALLIASMALLARLSRRVLKDRWLAGFAASMLALALPGVVVRAVTVSNLALVIPLTVACVTELWIAWENRASPRLVVAGVLLGLALLTDLFAVILVPLYLLVAVVVLWDRWSRREIAFAGAGILSALVLVLPWLAFNLVEYHALTATALAKSEQMATVNPHHLHYSLSLVATEAGSWLVSPTIPQEWTLYGHPFLFWLSSGLAAFVIPVALVLGLALGRRILSEGYWILALPWILNVVFCCAITYLGQWQTMLSRYTDMTLPLLGILLAAGAAVVFRDRWPFLVAVSSLAVGLVALWVGLEPQIHLLHAA